MDKRAVNMIAKKQQELCESKDAWEKSLDKIVSLAQQGVSSELVDELRSFARIDEKRERLKTTIYRGELSMTEEYQGITEESCAKAMIDGNETEAIKEFYRRNTHKVNHCIDKIRQMERGIE